MAFNWNTYQNPGMRNEISNGFTDTRGFYTPTDSKLMPGGRDQLLDFLTAGGTATPDMTTNRTVKYDGALTREQGANQTSFLNDQLGVGFGGIQSSLDQYAQYGGAFGDKNSPVYSPQSKNGYGSAWGNNNPFKIGSF